MKDKTLKFERKSKFAFRSQASNADLNNSNPTAQTTTTNQTITFTK